MAITFVPPTKREFDTLFLDRHSLKGGGIENIKIFQPTAALQRTRRGGGIFNVLSGLAKRAIPFLIRTIAPEAMQMGRGVLGDVLEGRKLRESLRSRGITAIRGVGERLARGGGKIRKKKVNKKKNKARQLKRGLARKCYKNDIFNSSPLV